MIDQLDQKTMKLFLIIYAVGQIGGWAGPLPYDMDQCVVHRDEMRERQAQAIKTGIDYRTGKKAEPSLLHAIRGMSFECEWREFTPVMGERKA